MSEAEWVELTDMARRGLGPPGTGEEGWGSWMGDGCVSLGDKGVKLYFTV